MCLRSLVLSDVGNSRHLTLAKLSVWWSGQTGRLEVWLSGERTWRQVQGSLLEMGSLEVEPRIPELKIS